MGAKSRDSKFREINLPVPPIEEQLVIEKFIAEMSDKFEALTTAGLEQVQLLQERCTALISAAVTGKIDVRDWTESSGEP